MKEIQKQAPGESVAGFAKQIKELWVQSRSDTLSDIFRLARTVYEGRDRLSRNWATLWKESGPLMPFSKRKGDMLVGIWRGLGWVDENEQTFAHFPKCWTTLYYLGLLERPVLENLLNERVIHPNLTVKEAKEIVALHKGQPVSKDPKNSDFRKKVERLCKCVSANMENAEAEYAWARGKLLSLAEQMEVAAGVRFVPTNIQGDLGLEDFE